MHELEHPPPVHARVLRRLEVGTGVAAGLLLLVTALFALGGLFADPPSPGATHEGFRLRPLVADFTGSVEFRPNDAATWRPLRWSDAFHEGDQLRTGPGATCDVLLTWNTGFRVAPGAELTWRRLESQGDRVDVELYLARGRVLASLDALPAGSRFVIETPTSRTKVKGTVLEVRADEDGARTTVLEGVVEVIDRSDPTRRVRVAAGEGAETRPGTPLHEIPLGAEERARLLAEDTALRERLRRLSPPREFEVRKGRVEVSAAEGEDENEDARSAPAPEGRPRAPAEPGPAAANEERAQARQAIRELIRAGISLVARGRVEQALAFCTPSFRAYVTGPLVQRAGVPPEYLREAGPTPALAARDAVRSQLQLTLELRRLEVHVEGEVAYVRGVVLATAVRLGEATALTRRYGCTARCIRQADGRWLLDLVTASEERSGS
ncbi:MAG: hypothetical protein D6731_21750 [Planctomycetota bacterium]|nr:MAG: hypothetical protein D6731_21750 [Planctomycetota bacterium]